MGSPFPQKTNPTAPSPAPAPNTVTAAAAPAEVRAAVTRGAEESISVRPTYTPFSSLMAAGGAGGIGGSGGQGSSERSPSGCAAEGDRDGAVKHGETGSRLSRMEDSITSSHYCDRESGRGRMYSTAESQLSNSDMSTTYSSSIAVSAAGLGRGPGDFSATGDDKSIPVGLAGLEIVPTAGGAPEPAAPALAGVGSAAMSTVARANTARTIPSRLMEPGAWSMSSAFGGGLAGTSGSSNRFGRVLGGTVGGGADWGLSSGFGPGNPGSVLGMSGFRLTVLEQRAEAAERRAEAAEEQGEFWQRRATTAEEENSRLKQVRFLL